MTGLKLENSNSIKATSPWKHMASKPDQQQKQLSAQQLSHQSSMSASGGDDHLFITPSDLLCPITLGLFQDPVCNALGQVYEKAAIQRHLVQAAINGHPPTDPISNAVLPSLDLVPVFPMRSRAAQYRESTARSCVQIAASPECPDPVRYLRRAAELMVTQSDSSSSSSSTSNPSNSGSSSSVLPPTSSSTPAAGMQQQGQLTAAAAAAAGGAGSPAAAVAAAAGGPGSPPAATPAAGVCAAGGMAFSIPGMTIDFARYLAAHQGSAYDALVLKYFGNELLRAGCPDAAADVFYRLLLAADDRVQQGEYLQLCLDCWTSSSSSIATAGEAGNGDNSAVPGQPCRANFSSSRAAGQQQQQQSDEEQQHDQQPSAAHNPVIIGKLADFVQRQRCLSPSAIVHMLQGMNHGPAMALQLCQVLLSRAAAAAAEAAGPEAEAAVGLPGGLGGALELLLSLVELGNGQLQEQLHALAVQLKAMEAVQQQQLEAAGSTGLRGEGGAAEAAAVASSTDAAAGDAAAGTTVAAAGTGKGSSRGSRRHGVSWRGGKGLDVLLGRAARAAAAGTFAVASLAGGNHPLLRLARVGPLMYLLRAGL